MKKVRGVLWGLILVAVGVLLLLNTLDVLAFDIFFKGFWTLFIIVPCTIALITEKERLGSLIGLCVGVFLLLCSRGVLAYALLWKLLLPIIVVLIGLRIVCGTLFGRKKTDVANMPPVSPAARNTTAVFNGARVSFAGEAFDGAALRAVFGGIECDLRDAVIDKDCVIDATAVFGGIELYVPQGVNVQVTSTAVCGGVSDHTKQETGAHTLYLRATCVFGGIDVK